MNPSKLKLVRSSLPLVIFLLTVAAFFPALHNGFVELDDDSNFLTNTDYRGLGWNQLRWMFTTFHMGHYQPLSWVTLGLDYSLWGMDPFGYHLTNVLLHAANAVVFYFLCARLLSLATEITADNIFLRAGAAVAALLFAVHPLRVESVAWVTERRDVLSGLFFLLALLWYLKTATAETKESRRKWLALTLFVYSLSLLSKAIGMSLPAVLLILDVYPLKRLGWTRGRWFGREVRGIWLEKLPFAVLAAIAAWLAVLAQMEIGAMMRVADYGMIDRVAQAAYNFIFYAWKTFLPFHLLPLHEIPWNFDPWHWSYVASALAFVVLTGALIALRKSRPAALANWLYYTAMILPVSGVVQSGIQLAADRYSYLSCLGLTVLIGGGWFLAMQRRPERSRAILACGLAFSSVVIVGLGAMTWRQTQLWHDSERLLQYVIALNPRSKIAHNNLGNILARRGQTDEAITHYRAALEADPYYTVVYLNLAEVLSAKGEFAEAARHYQNVLRYPGPVGPRAAAYTGLGILLDKQGKSDEAMAGYREALRLDRKFTLARVNLGEATARRGEFDEAIKHFRVALENDPRAAAAHYHWGNVLMRRGDWGGAVEQYRRAIDIDPKNVEALTNLGGALGARGEDDAAIGQYRAALKIKPDHAPAHYNLGILLGEKGRAAEAIEHFREAIAINPRDAEAHFYLGKYLAMEGKTEEAAGHFRAALAIQPDFPEAKDHLKRLAAGRRK